MEGVLDVWDLNFSLKHPLIKVKNNMYVSKIMERNKEKRRMGRKDNN